MHWMFGPVRALVALLKVPIEACKRVSNHFCLRAANSVVGCHLRNLTHMLTFVLIRLAADCEQAPAAQRRSVHANARLARSRSKMLPCCATLVFLSPNPTIRLSLPLGPGFLASWILLRMFRPTCAVHAPLLLICWTFLAVLLLIVRSPVHTQPGALLLPTLLYDELFEAAWTGDVAALERLTVDESTPPVRLWPLVPIPAGCCVSSAVHRAVCC